MHVIESTKYIPRSESGNRKIVIWSKTFGGGGLSGTMRAMKRTIAIMPKMNNIVRTGLATRTAQWLLLLVVCSQSCLTFNLGSLSKTLDTGSSDLISGAKAAPLSAQNMEEDNPLQVVASSTGALGSHPSSLMSRQPSYPLLLRKAPAEASKGQPSVETRVVQEVECTESVFLSPFHGNYETLY